MVDFHLPTYPIPIVGRVREVAQITSILSDSSCHLLTLVGPGGIGKTRLAIEAARLSQNIYHQGVYFVSLQALNTPDFIVPEIAQTVRLQFNPGNNTREQLLDFFREKSLLLVLDNFEHLLGGADIISEILTAARGVKVLITSRERVNLREEWVFEVPGLSFPQSENESHILGYEALQLFIQNARRVRVGIELSDAQMKAVTRICRMVGGMPLGIELAAAWVRTLSCEAIADEIAHSLDILETVTRNVEPRHRTMRSTFKSTWDRLSEIEQDAFNNMSVFRGGFTRVAAESIAGASLQTLSSLVDKSLLRLNDNGRYELHELLLQYSTERLNESPEKAEQTHDRHCSYYANFLKIQWRRLTGSEIKSAIRDINIELDNVRAAWDWAVGHLQAQAIEAMLDSLWFFYDTDARGHEGEQVFENAVHRLKASVPKQADLWAKVLARQGAICFTYRPDKSKALLQESEALLRDVGAHSDHAFALSRLWMVTQKDEWAVRIARLEESLALYTELDNQWAIGQILELLCRMYIEEGLLQRIDELLRQAQSYGQKCLVLYQQCSSHYGIAMACMSLGSAAYQLGEYQAAYDYYQKSAAIFQDISVHWGGLYSFRGLGESACGMGQYATARRFERQALQYLFDLNSSGTHWFTLFLLCVVVDIWLGEGNTEGAYELLAVIGQQVQKLGVQNKSVEFRSLSRLDKELPPHLTEAVERGRGRDFDSVLKEVIADLNSVESATLSSLVETLSEREIEILRLITEGLNSREAAQRLHLGVTTIRWYLRQIYSKLNVHSRSEALARAREFNLL